MNDNTLQTERLLLRPWREDDAETLYRHASDPEVGPRAGWPPHKSVEESLGIIRTVFHNDRTWAIVLKTSGEPIGCIGYYTHCESNIGIGPRDAEIGYWVARPYWNRGIGTEALLLMTDHCFHAMGFETLWCDHFVDNPASGRVMEKCGFSDTGRVNRCSHLYHAADRPVRIMKLTQKHRNNMTHGHEVLAMMQGHSYTEQSLVEAIIGRFGADERFYTCSADNLTAQGLVDFLKAQGKFKPLPDGFTVDTTKVCANE